MAIMHMNRRQQIYYLHQGKTKTGKPKYFFSMKSEGDLVDTVPDGYETYENPRAQVFLRKIPKKVITDEEIAIVEKGMKKFAKVDRFIIDVKKAVISIFTPTQDLGRLSESLAGSTFAMGRNPQAMASSLEKFLDYSSDMQFVLIDKHARIFQTERYCYRGAIDDWIAIGPSGDLATLVETYVKHIDQESFFDLQ